MAGSPVTTGPAVADETATLGVAERLLACPVRRVTGSGAGANSRVITIETGAERYALKRYPDWRMSGALRCRAEWRALKFLQDCGVEEVPAPIAYDENAAILILEWIEGNAITNVCDTDVDIAADFVARVGAPSTHPLATSFPFASEACLSGKEILRQIKVRRAAFVEHAALGAFFERTFDPALEEANRRAHTYGRYSQELETKHRCLVPADFGLHNALREVGGRLRFFDFDYFGWDDPVKLTADFCHHPAMELTDGHRRRFARAMMRSRAMDEEFGARLESYWSLYALRWALIVLNVLRCDRVDGAGWPDEQRIHAQVRIAEVLVNRALTSPDAAASAL